MLGIIIGVGAVITLLSVGEGVQNLVRSQLQSIGTNLLFVVSGNLAANTRSAAGLTLKDAQAIGDPFNAPDVIAVAPEVLANADVSRGKTSIRVSVSGVTPDYASVRNRKVQ